MYIVLSYENDKTGVKVAEIFGIKHPSWIRTNNLLFMSLLPKPLDHGFLSGLSTNIFMLPKEFSQN